MIIVPSAGLTVGGQSTQQLVVSDTRSVNLRQGRMFYLKQLWFWIANNGAGQQSIFYDAYVTVNGEPVGLLPGQTGALPASGTTIAPSVIQAAFSPGVPLLRTDTIQISTIFTAHFGASWPGFLTQTYGYMLNIDEVP